LKGPRTGLTGRGTLQICLQSEKDYQNGESGRKTDKSDSCQEGAEKNQKSRKKPGRKENKGMESVPECFNGGPGDITKK